MNEIPDKNPFKVPGNYFEEVNRKIISVTSGFEEKTPKTDYHRLRVFLFAAAAFAGLVLIGYAASKILNRDKKELAVSEVLYEENPELYVNDIDISSLDEFPPTLFITSGEPVVNKSEIIDYLMLENIEINDIYEQF